MIIDDSFSSFQQDGDDFGGLTVFIWGLCLFFNAFVYSLKDVVEAPEQSFLGVLRHENPCDFRSNHLWAELTDLAGISYEVFLNDGNDKIFAISMKSCDNLVNG